MAEKIFVDEKIMEFEKSWKNHGILAWDCFLDVNISQILKNQVFIFEQSNPKIHLFMQDIYFCLLNSIIGQKKIGCNTLNDRRNLTISHGIIMENSWNFILYFL